MRIALLSGGDGWHVRDLSRAAIDLGHAAEQVDFRRISATTTEASLDLRSFDGIIVRTMPPGSLEQVVFRMDMLHDLAARGIPVLNPPRALEICVDKYLALVRLQSAGLPVPETFVCQHAESAIEAFETLGGDVVVKPIFGSEGRGMVRITDAELAWRTFRTLERTQSVLYVQRFIKHPGWDLRIFVLNGKVLAGIRRVGRSDWRTNVAQGAVAEAITMTAEHEALALQAASAVGTVAAGVDLLMGPDGTMFVIEINAVPGWRALAPATGIDVARELILALQENYQPDSTTNFISHASQLACLWEATARKAGNVHPRASFDDLTYADFVRSGLATSSELGKAQTRALGETILAAVQATQRSVTTNANLGIILLLAPLAKVPETTSLRHGVRHVLARTTIDDAVRVYEAIRIASPGGLGDAKEQDVRQSPTIPLRSAMALAADRDMVARQYAQDFADVFDLGLPALLEGVERFGHVEPAVQHCQLVWLAAHHDSLIVRKRGIETAEEVRSRARSVLQLGGISTPEGRSAYAELDDWLRVDGHARNPGTTADLITACLFVALRERKISMDCPL